MSVLKYSNNKNRGPDAIRKSITYILNPDKTTSNLIKVNGVSPDTPCEDMETVQVLLGKNTGRRYIHIILSFDQNISATTAYDVACSAAEYFAECYLYILASHTNTANLHAHIILNAVNIRTGKKFSQSRKEMLAFRSYVNKCLRAYGLNEIGRNKTPVDFLEEDFNYMDNFFDDDDYYDDEENEQPYSYFGPCDPEELDAISEAEEADRLRKSAYDYFEGKATDFPDEIPYCDADALYFDWLEMKNREREEAEAETEKSFFDRFPEYPGF